MNVHVYWLYTMCVHFVFIYLYGINIVVSQALHLPNWEIYPLSRWCLPFTDLIAVVANILKFEYLAPIY